MELRMLVALAVLVLLQTATLLYLDRPHNGPAWDAARVVNAWVDRVHVLGCLLRRAERPVPPVERAGQPVLSARQSRRGPGVRRPVT